MATEDVQPEAPLQESVRESVPAVLTADDRMWGLLAHLSALLGLLGAGYLNFLGPLVVWLIKRDQSRFVDDQGKESLNFQLNMLIYMLILVAVSVATCGIALMVTIPLHAALAIYAIIMPIVAALKANEGVPFRYPLTFRIIN